MGNCYGSFFQDNLVLCLTSHKLINTDISKYRDVHLFKEVLYKYRMRLSSARRLGVAHQGGVLLQILGLRLPGGPWNSGQWNAHGLGQGCPAPQSLAMILFPAVSRTAASVRSSFLGRVTTSDPWGLEGAAVTSGGGGAFP